METQNLDAIAESVKQFTAATKTQLDELGSERDETKSRLLAMEQKLAGGPPGGPGLGNGKSVGDLLVASEGFKSLQGGARSSGQIRIGELFKTTVVNASGTAQPLVPMQYVPGITIPGGVQRLTIRDLLPSIPTTSNLIAFARETSFTNNAAMQTSEGAAKAESAATYDQATAPVQTLAHFIPVSRQLMDDSTAFSAYINGRMLYLLKLVEEQQLLSGNGVGTNLSGLIQNSTAFNTADSSTADTYIDVVQKAITQMEDNSNLPADGIVLNNLDWAMIQRIKTTGTASSGEYIFSDPHAITGPRLWGLPVVATKSMPRNQGLVGNFRIGAAIWDRNDATVEISREHSDYFVRNLIACLVEERLALTVFAPLAFCYFGFPFGS